MKRILKPFGIVALALSFLGASWFFVPTPAGGGCSAQDIATLKFNLDATDFASAGAVSSWTDNGPNAWTVTEGTGANQPQSVLNVYNSKPTVRFDGNDRLRKTGLAAGEYLVAYGEAFCVWFIGKFATAGGADYQQPLGLRTKPGDLGKVLGFGWAQNDAVYQTVYFGNTQGVNAQADWGTHRLESSAPTGTLQMWKVCKSTGSPLLAASFSGELDNVVKTVSAVSGNIGQGWTSNDINIGESNGTTSSGAVFDLSELTVAGEDSSAYDTCMMDKWGL